jgi:two-component system, LytTR family, sensor kinase
MQRFPTIFLGYTLFGLFQAVANSLTYLSTSGRANWIPSIKRSLGEWWAWAALTPLILHLAARWPLQKSTLVKHGALHLFAMGAIAVLKLYIDRWVRLRLFGNAGPLLIGNLALNLIVYAGIVAAAHGFRYYHASRDRELHASQLEARLVETRLQLISMQLQPHFLFNTLNAISELVHEDPETADRMIAGLSVLLRQTLDVCNSPAVDIERELDLLHSYVDIQRARFGSRLDVTISAQAGALRATVPVLMLQTLVENAIRHGLSKRRDAGRIEIAITRDGDRVRLEVRDDGRGVGEEPRDGIGLTSTRARLEGLFGQDHTFDVSNAPSGGTLVTATIPFRPMERSEPEAAAW